MLGGLYILRLLQATCRVCDLLLKFDVHVDLQHVLLLEDQEGLEFFSMLGSFCARVLEVV